MDSCIFCKIIKGEIPSKKVYEDDDVYAFYDINPQSKIHILIIPKKHFSDISEISPDNEKIIGKIFSCSKKIAQELSLSNDGYRIVTNKGKYGCQSVFHLHFHLLGGEQLSEKMV